jgi:hypothetical protein
MTPSQTPTPFISTITKHLPLVERVLFMALGLGTILRIMYLVASVTKVALLGLGVTFFLLAYRPNEIPRQENEQFGFSELLALLIAPKVLWISSAISALGIAFYLFDFGNTGYKNLLMIGGMTIGVATAVLVFSLAKGVKYLETVTPILFRAIPLLFVDFYILFR